MLLSRQMWQADLKDLFSESMTQDWQQSVNALNELLGLRDDAALRLTFPDLPPIWFNGDVEALEPGRWTLVVSLNHQLGTYPVNPSRSTYWDFCRTHNRKYWYGRFFAPLVTVASIALGDEMALGEEPEYATSRMVFVELCPYASRTFSLSSGVVADLVETDPGFQTAHRVIELLIGGAEPGLVLLNGNATIASFEAIYGKRLGLWATSTYDSASGTGRKLWHRQGYLESSGQRTPIAGFPFLRKPRTHNSNDELLQLGRILRDWVNQT